MNILDWITAAASTATAIGVLIAVFQLWHAEKLAKTQFEDQLRKDYRDLCAQLPVKALLGEKLSDQELEDALSVFHQYFHLCNSQIFLRAQGRIAPSTWQMWARGLSSNFQLVAFRQAWDYMNKRASTNRLEYLTRYMNTGHLDPKLQGLIT